MNAQRKTRPRGFAPWNPRPDTLALVKSALNILTEYEDYLPLTIRQCFYRLVATAGYGKTEKAYARLCETVSRARRAGLIDFSAIRDDGASRHEAQCWPGPDAFLDAMREDAARFRLDRQEGQDTRLWLLCEAGGMAPMLYQAAVPYGVPVLTSGGFDSLTAKHTLARELAAAMRGGYLAEVLHIGDHDPSGVHLFTSLAEDVAAMVRALGGGACLTFTRLAVTEAQIATLRLPTAPAKVTDRRAFVGETVQAEAIPPDVLTAMVQAAISERQDANARADMLTREAEARAELLDRLGVAE